MDNLRLFVNTWYRDHVVRYLARLDKEKQKQLIGSIYLVLTLFAVAFFGLFAISPTISTITNLRRQYEDYKTIEAELTQKIESLSLLGIAYQDLRPSIELLDNAFPKSPEIPSLLRKVETIASSYNLTVLQLGSSAIELYPALVGDPPYFSYTFAMFLEGSEEDFKNFLSDIINFDRTVTVEGISVSKTENESIIQANISGKVYFNK